MACATSTLTIFITALALGSGASAADAAPQLAQLGQLGKWLHGDPPPQPKAAPPRQLAQVSTASAVVVDVAVESFLRELAAALMARDGRPLLARLSEQYGIDDLPAGEKPSAYFLQAVERLPGPQSMTVQSVVGSGAFRVASVEFRYSTERADVKALGFDAAGRLVHSDLFRLKRMGAAGGAG